MLPKEIETEVELLQIQGDNGTILFVWSVFKHSLAEEYVDSAKRVLETLFKKKIMKSFAECVTAEMFYVCFCHNVFNQFFKYICKCRIVRQEELY